MIRLIDIHDYRAFLTPDALGGVFGLHIGLHSILEDAGDVLLNHVSTVVSAGIKELCQSEIRPSEEQRQVKHKSLLFKIPSFVLQIVILDKTRVHRQLKSL